ncbi:MAG: histidine kinase [Bacteroidia bacterium]|nr:histidine kinase [Bacteroidia bacterium]
MTSAIKLLRIVSVFVLSLIVQRDLIAVTQPSYFVLAEKQFNGIEIYDVIQDKNYNYWFATSSGIFRYDCYTFTSVKCFGMKGNSVFGFTEARNGEIFCYNLNAQIFRIADNKCNLYYELLPDERSTDVHLTCNSDSDLVVLCRTPFLFDRNKKKHSASPSMRGYHGIPFTTSDGRIICSRNGSDSVLVIQGTTFTTQALHSSESTNLGVYKFLKFSTGTVAVNLASKVFYDLDEKSLTLSKRIQQPFESNGEYFSYYVCNDMLWIARIMRGIYISDDLFANPTPVPVFNDWFISDVYKDREGNILLSTFGVGVLVIPDVTIEGAIALPSKQVPMSIGYSATGDNLVVGSENGKLYEFANNNFGILAGSGTRPLKAMFTWKDCPFILYDDGEMNDKGNVKACFNDDHEIICLTKGSLKDAVQVSSHEILAAFNIGTYRITWNNKREFTVEQIQELRIRCHNIAHAGNTGITAIATSQGLKLLYKDGSVLPVNYNNVPLFVTEITADDSSIFAVNADGEVLKINAAGNIFKMPLDEMENEEIVQLITNGNRLYSHTDKNIYVHEYNGKLIRKISGAESFSGMKINDFCVSGDEIWVANNSGIQKFDLKDSERQLPAPLLSFSMISAGSDTLDLLQNEFSFEESARKFRFVISSPTLRHTANIRYHYRLLGNDTGWTIADYAEHDITYQSLPAGDYTFVVKAENQGVFSNVLTFHFTVTGPFWSTWWFYALATLIIGILITLVYLNRLRVQQRKSKLINELYASRLTAIQSQMNPHFIFNSLNSIQDLVLKGDIDNSYTYITTFSDMVRRTMNYSEKDFIDFEQELKLLNLYLSLEQLRFRQELHFTIDEGNTEDIMIPPMLIQPFIENALVHGLLHKQGEKKLSIHFELGDNLKCTIEDNGIGRKKSRQIRERQRGDYESFSGRAIEKRFEILNQLYGTQCGYTYEDLRSEGEPTGTRVTIVLPVKHKF